MWLSYCGPTVINFSINAHLKRGGDYRADIGVVLKDPVHVRWEISIHLNTPSSMMPL